MNVRNIPVVSREAVGRAADAILAVLADGQRHMLNESRLYRAAEEHGEAFDVALDELERQDIIGLAYRQTCTRLRLVSAGSP